MKEEDLTLQEVADRLGVHYMTVYRYVRLGQLPARKVGASWKVAATDLNSFQHEKGSQSSRGLSRETSAWAERLEARMLEGDQSGSWGVVEAALTSGAVPLEVYTHMLIPALDSIGKRWAGGELSVGDEHLASAVATRIIGRLGPRFARRGRHRGSVVVAGAPGERHGLGLAMVVDALRGEGYEVLDLGPDTPLDSLVKAIERTERLRGVCIGVTSPESRSAAAAMTAAVRAAAGSDVVVVLGGGAIDDDHDARALGGDATAAVDTVASVVEAGRSPAPVDAG